MDEVSTNTGGPPIGARRIYRDYRAVQGLQWPFSEERLIEGETAMRMQVRTVKLNGGVSDQTFGRPKPPAPTEP